MAPSPPDGGWGWVVCAASFLCNMILDGIAYCFGVLISPLCDYFDSDKGTVSWVGSLLCGVEGGGQDGGQRGHQGVQAAHVEYLGGEAEVDCEESAKDDDPGPDGEEG